MIEVAEQAARAGGDVIARYFRDGVEIRSKATAHDLVSDADVEAERAVAEVLASHCPHHALLGEEIHRGAADAEHLWVIDPLDGTNNFAHGIPHFAVSIGYYCQGRPQVGVILNPVRGDLYVAIRGEGAYANGTRVRVAPHTELNQALVGVGFYYDRGAMMQGTLRAIEGLFAANIHGIRRFGTAALDLVQVGMGWFGGFFEYELSPWDFAAGRLFVEEAGGQVTNCRGEPLPLARSSVLASNGRLHPALLEIVSPHLPASP